VRVEGEGDGLPAGGENELAVGVEGARHEEAEGALGVAEEEADRLEQVLVEEGSHGGLDEAGGGALLEGEAQRRPRGEAGFELLQEHRAQLLARPLFGGGGLELLLGLSCDGLELRFESTTSEIRVKKSRTGDYYARGLKRRAFTSETVGIL
jgi:hypothetical protein